MLRRTQWLVGLVFLICFRFPLAAWRKPAIAIRSTKRKSTRCARSADYPDKRLELMISFATSAHGTRSINCGPTRRAAKDRPMQIHDLLQDFSSLLDEIDDNVDMYASHKTDMRKGLRLLIEADSEWALKLRELKEQSPPEELEQYSFVLDQRSSRP